MSHDSKEEKKTKFRPYTPNVLRHILHSVFATGFATAREFPDVPYDEAAKEHLQRLYADAVNYIVLWGEREERAVLEELQIARREVALLQQALDGLEHQRVATMKSMTDPLKKPSRIPCHACGGKGRCVTQHIRDSSGGVTTVSHCCPKCRGLGTQEGAEITAWAEACGAAQERARITEILEDMRCAGPYQDGDTFERGVDHAVEAILQKVNYPGSDEPAV